MKVTSKGQVTIPLEVRKAMGIMPSETEVEFRQDDSGRWYLFKLQSHLERKSRFRTAHKNCNVSMSTEEIMSLTRG